MQRLKDGWTGRPLIHTTLETVKKGLSKRPRVTIQLIANNIHGTTHDMTDIANQVRSLIETFTVNIAALVRQDTLRQISEALSGVGKITVRRGPGRPRGPAAKKPGEKRTALDLEKTSAAVFACITSNPGLGVESLAIRISMPSRDLKLPIKKLLADGLVKTKGQRRGTKYFVK